MKPWVGFAGIIVLLVLIVGTTPFWMDFANKNQGAASALAAGIGVIVTLAVLVVYWHQAHIMTLQARTMERQAGIMEGQQNLQRAWLVAGMGRDHYGKSDAKDALITGPNGRPVRFCRPNFHNYGQTPAFVSYLDWNFCPDPPPKEPDWRACKRLQINNWTDTSGEPKVIEVEPSHEMTTPTIIFYGRLTYQDVLKRERYCGFIYRWRLDAKNHDRLGDEYPAYVEWE
jgi:hypothetical protein